MICPDHVVTRAELGQVGDSNLRESGLAAEVGAAGARALVEIDPVSV
jgi:hypothetical protein